MKSIIKKVLPLLFLITIILAQSFPAFAAGTGPATLQVTNCADREIISYSYSFDRPTNDNGSISGIPSMTKMVIKVKPLRGGNTDLQQWMLSEKDARDVAIVISSPATGEAMKTIQMAGAQCLNYEMRRSNEVGDYEEIEIVCESLQNGSVKYEQIDSSVTGTMVSNDSQKNQIAVICASAAALIVVAGAIVVVSKKKKNI